MNFLQKAQMMLEQLFEQLDENYGDTADITDTPDSITITLDDGRTWLVNIQTHHEELWLSSPISGGHHYHLEGNYWYNTKDPNAVTLHALLFAEIEEAS